MPILDTIESPGDIKRLDAAGLKDLAAEIRAAIIDVVGRNGGPVASNLGVFALTLGLH